MSVCAKVGYVVFEMRERTHIGTLIAVLRTSPGGEAIIRDDRATG